jgi:ferrous iron transport protein B
MNLRIALAGNPNSGKTTLFNHLTGSSQYVGNWPGVTVEKKEGRLKGDHQVFIQDLPGIYSLSPYTLEEVIARNYLVTESPQAIINIVDGTNIERNLYLTTQLLELGIPMVVAVNMMDLVTKSGDHLDLQKLEDSLGCDFIEMSALKGKGTFTAAKRAKEAAEKQEQRAALSVFHPSIETALHEIEGNISGKVPGKAIRWYAVKLFERDAKLKEELALSTDKQEKIESVISACETEFEDDAESVITNQRYTFITGIIQKAVVKKQADHALTVSDRIDRIVTNRVLALPIFAVIMFLVYYVSISTVGDLVTGWTNDTLFGELICANLRSFLTGIGTASWLTGLVVDGIVGGVGLVIGFVPQMLILFLMLSILEDVGYMTRVAFIMDRIFRRFGLSGKSFIPMLISSGCGVPGIMSCRTIENERDRRMTIMTTTFIPCGAKMPIIALFAGALFGGSGLMATSAYFIGVAAVIISGIILKKTHLFAGDPAPFVMELPAYHVPSVNNVLRATWERGWSFIQRAGTVILASSIILWFLQGFGIVNGALTMVEDNNGSLLAILGSAIAPLFSPLGFDSWKATVATITGLIAKENVVGTFGVLYGFAQVAENGAEIWSNLAADFTHLSAYSFMIFNLLCAPCFAAMGAIKREMNNFRWTWIAIGYMTVFAYIAAFLVYQFGLFFGGYGFTVSTAIAIVLAFFVIYLLFRSTAKKQGVVHLQTEKSIVTE